MAWLLVSMTGTLGQWHNPYAWLGPGLRRQDRQP